MTKDPVVLRQWMTVLVYITTVCVNSVPLMYSFSPWTKTILGRLFMLQGVSFAVILDATILFQRWHVKDIVIIFWTAVVLYSAISVSTAAMAWHIWKLNKPNRKRVVLVKFTGAVYDFLKRAAQIYIPALGTLYFTVAQIWGLPSPEEVVGTIVAVDTALGVMLGISQSTYNASGDKYGGSIEVRDGEDGSTLHIQGLDANKILTQPDITFKIVKTTAPPAV